MSFLSQIAVTEAIRVIQSHARPMPSQHLPLAEAYGRVLAEELASKVSHPSLANSALDGFACHVADTLTASPENPVRLTVVGDVPAGSIYKAKVARGEAVSIYTGAPMVVGLDGIIRVEDTERDGDEVLLRQPASSNDIRPAGQDFKRGDVLLRAGDVLGAAAVGIAASMGYAAVDVRRQPRIGILATGDEVVEPGEAIRDGQVYNSNVYSVAALLRAAGALPVMFPRIKDDPEALRSAFAAVGPLDLLLTSGGVSMGKYDFVRDLLFDEGEVYFWKVAQKPAGPVLFGRWQTVPVLGLPGNPVSSMIAFLILGWPFVHSALGRTDNIPYQQRWQVIAETAIKGAGFKEGFSRVRLRQEGTVFMASSTGNQSSGVLSSMLHADALAIVPPHTSYQPGDVLEVIPLYPFLPMNAAMANEA